MTASFSPRLSKMVAVMKEQSVTTRIHNVEWELTEESGRAATVERIRKGVFCGAFSTCYDKPSNELKQIEFDIGGRLDRNSALSRETYCALRMIRNRKMLTVVSIRVLNKTRGCRS